MFVKNTCIYYTHYHKSFFVRKFPTLPRSFMSAMKMEEVIYGHAISRNFISFILNCSYDNMGKLFMNIKKRSLRYVNNENSGQFVTNVKFQEIEWEIFNLMIIIHHFHILSDNKKVVFQWNLDNRIMINVLETN